MTDHERQVLGEVLLDFDRVINHLDRLVFEAANERFNRDGLDAQRDRALSSSFQPPVKGERDKAMVARNGVAGLLGFDPRRPHDLSPRDYVVRDGALQKASS